MTSHWDILWLFEKTYFSRRQQDILYRPPSPPFDSMDSLSYTDIQLAGHIANSLKKTTVPLKWTLISKFAIKKLIF